MRPVEEVYPDAVDEDGEFMYSGASDYRPLLDSMGHRIVVERDEDDYQGDSFLLMRRDDGAWGVLTFGWGSCSGCDALQACASYREIEELRAQLARDVHWFDTPGACGEWLSRDRSGDWYGNSEAWDEFVVAAQSALDGEGGA